MALADYKITKWEKPVTALADKPKLTAADLKAWFDGNSGELKTAFNGLIDALRASAAAGEIGAEAIAGVSGTTVQGMLLGMKALLDTMQTAAGADEKLAEKADKTTVAGMVKSIAFDQKTGVFTITEQGGTVHQIDTAIEKVPLACRLDGEDFVLTLVDGNEQRVSLAKFIHANEFDDSGTIRFSVLGGRVSAAIQPGSVTDDMLSSALRAALLAYRDAAATSAQNAAASEANAKTYAGNAETHAANAAGYRNAAQAYAAQAQTATVRQPQPNAETGTWWVWDQTSQAYADSGISCEGNIDYVTFDIDESGHLIACIPDRYEGPMFRLTDDGNLEAYYDVT